MQLMILAIAIAIGRFLQRRKVVWIGEAGAALLLGLVVGVIMQYAGVSNTDLRQMLTFKV